MTEYIEANGELILVCEHEWGNLITAWYEPLNKYVPTSLCSKCGAKKILMPYESEFRNE